MLLASYRGEYTVYTRCMSEVGELLLEAYKERKGWGSLTTPPGPRPLRL